MDVILDSNTYFRALEKGGASFITEGSFSDLFAYLRRKGSTLIIPDLVLEEFSRLYTERVRLAAKTHSSAFGTLARDLTKDIENPIKINPAEEWNSFKLRLLNPGRGVTVSPYQGWDKVSLREVAMRGVHRRKPASDVGEELRDVALWLIALAYAEEHPVAFITDDGHFKDKDNVSLHPDLVAEVTRVGAKLEYYPTITKFITTKSPAPKNTTREELTLFLPDAELVGFLYVPIIKFFERRGDGVSNLQIHGVNFARGARYEIDKNSFFFELSYTASTTFVFTQTIAAYTWVNAKSADEILTASAFTGTPVLPGSVYVPPENVHLENILSTQEYGPIFNNIARHTFPHTIQNVIDAQFWLDITVRVENEERKSVEIENIEVKVFKDRGQAK